MKIRSVSQMCFRKFQTNGNFYANWVEKDSRVALHSQPLVFSERRRKLFYFFYHFLTMTTFFINEYSTITLRASSNSWRDSYININEMDKHEFLELLRNRFSSFAHTIFPISDSHSADPKNHLMNENWANW